MVDFIFEPTLVLQGIFGDIPTEVYAIQIDEYTEHRYELFPTGLAKDGTIEMKSEPVDFTGYIERVDIKIGTQIIEWPVDRKAIVAGSEYVFTIRLTI